MKKHLWEVKTHSNAIFEYPSPIKLFVTFEENLQTVAKLIEEQEPILVGRIAAIEYRGLVIVE